MQDGLHRRSGLPGLADAIKPILTEWLGPPPSPGARRCDEQLSRGFQHVHGFFTHRTLRNASKNPLPIAFNQSAQSTETFAALEIHRPRPYSIGLLHGSVNCSIHCATPSASPLATWSGEQPHCSARSYLSLNVPRLRGPGQNSAAGGDVAGCS